MKTLAELKQMHFIPHHDCSICGEMVGWYTDESEPYFDPSCGCGSSGGHYDTWERVFKQYNRVFEKESEQDVNAAWERNAVMGSPSEFSDRNIPKVCRDCRFCHHYLPISDWMPSWLPWEYECQSKDARRYDHEAGVEVCANKEAK